MSQNGQKELKIPGALNLSLLVLAIAISLLCLWTASHSNQVLWIGFAALIFSFVANTIFSLLHEAVHGVLHSNRQINLWAGRLAAAFFPTSFGLQRGFHLVHHRNNRSELERFDYIQPGEIKWLKFAQWYAILTGVYWVVSVLGVLVYFFCSRQFAIADLSGKKIHHGPADGFADLFCSL